MPRYSTVGRVHFNRIYRQPWAVESLAAVATVSVRKFYLATVIIY